MIKFSEVKEIPNREEQLPYGYNTSGNYLDEDKYDDSIPLDTSVDNEREGLLEQRTILECYYDILDEEPDDIKLR